MKTLKYILLAIVALAGFSACSDDAAETGPNGINGKGVYFPVTASESILLANGQNVITVPVMRTDSEGEFNTRILFNPGVEGEDIFTADASVRFADGETTSSVDISFDFNDIEEGTKYAMSLSLADETNASSYGRTSYSFVVLFDPWDDLCNATFIDYAFSDGRYTVPVQRKSGTTNRFRLVNPYAQGLEEKYAGIPTVEPSEYLEFIVREDGLVLYDEFMSGVIDEEDNEPLVYCHPSYWPKYQDESYWQYNIALADGFYHIAPLRLIGDSGYLYDNSQMMGVIYIIFETADLSDMSIDASFVGSLIEPDQSTTSAMINVAVGEDVAYFKYTVVPGNLEEDASALEALIEGIAAGTVEAETETESGVLKFALSEMGLYTFAAVTFDDTDKPKESTHVVFAFSPAGGGLPECEFELVAKLDASGYYDPSTSLIYTVTGTDIAKMWVWREPISEIERYGLKESDYAAWTKQYGWDLVEAGYLDYVNDSTGFPGLFPNLEPDTEYVVMAYGENSYGKGLLRTATITTAEGAVKWESIGMGVYYDDFMFGLKLNTGDNVTVPVDVEILQATSGVEVPTYRIVDPYPADLMDLFINNFGAGDMFAGRTDPFIQFEVDPTSKLVYFGEFYNGYLYDGNPVLAVHPSGMSGNMDVTHNVERSEGIYQMAPYFYVEALGGGFPYHTYDDIIIVTLPGHDLSEIETELVPYPLASNNSLSNKSKSDLFCKMRVAPYIFEPVVRDNASQSELSKVVLPVEKKSTKLSSSRISLQEASRLMKPVRM